MKFRKMTVAGTAWLHDTDIGHPDDTRTTARTFYIETDAFRNGGDTAQSRTASRRSSSHWRSTARPGVLQPDVTTGDLTEFIRVRPNSFFARMATQYILAMALCHTCLPGYKNGKTEHKASSPDEMALVRAAKELGLTVVQRSSQQITLNHHQWWLYLTQSQGRRYRWHHTRLHREPA